MSGDDAVERIDRELTFYSAGLGPPTSVEWWMNGDEERARATIRQIEASLQSLGVVVTTAIEQFAAFCRSELAPMLARVAEVYKAAAAPLLGAIARMGHVYRRWNDPMKAATKWTWKLDKLDLAKKEGTRWVAKKVGRSSS